MKRFLRIAQVLAVLVVGSVLSLSCILDSGGSSGSVQFTIKGPGDTARVYLATTGGALAPIGGSEDFLEVSLSSGAATVTIEGLPAGAEYQAFFGLGNRDNGWLQTERYKVSDPFEISAGTNVEVDLGTLKLTSDIGSTGITYSPQLMNKSVKGVVVLGNIYVPTADTLYVLNSGLVLQNSYPLPGGFTANSISLVGFAIDGAGSLWLNTNKGILPTDGSGSYEENFSVNLGNVQVLDSGAFQDGTDSYVYFQRDSGLGGVKDTGATTFGNWSWLDIDLSDVIQGQPVHDLVIDATNDFGYFATTLGSFRMSKAMLDAGSRDFLNDAYSDFFQVGGNIPVIAIDYDVVGTLKFVMGTEDGVWTSDLHPVPPTGSSTLEPGTSGKRFHTVATSGDRWAALSALYLYIDNGSAVSFIPFNVRPAGVTGMAWDGANLVIAADEGLISITP